VKASGCYIPHFIHSPFLSSLSFGDCLVNSLYAVYEKHRTALPSVSRHAGAGGTKHYSELLKPFGLDAREPNSGRRAVGHAG